MDIDATVAADGHLELDIPDEQKAEIVRKHLVMSREHTIDIDETHTGPSYHRSDHLEVPSDVMSATTGTSANASGIEGDLYSASHQLLGGDITREVYKWQEDMDRDASARPRAQSFYLPREETQEIQIMKEPGGFRRNYIRAKADQNGTRPPANFTRNFIDFLTIYGHFAGEDLSEGEDETDEEEDEPDLEAGGGPSSGLRQRAVSREIQHGPAPTERTPLIRTTSLRRKRTKSVSTEGTATVTKAVLLLLKSFVGTGVLFLGRGFANGGMLFSSLVLLGIAGVSLFSFLLLVKTRLHVPGSFGDIGGVLYGPYMRLSILCSITISQIGFVCAYMIFTSANLQAFLLAVTNCRLLLDTKWLILLQLIIFLPLAMIRNISRLSGTALVADAFILLGLIYLYYYDISLVASQGIADITLFNPSDFALFIGTAVFTFEGIGLIIPITESMKEPQRFPMVLTGVMLGITVIFTSMGALSYAAFGEDVQTVVILNLPQDNRFVNAVQLLYSIAILLSTPLQLFPAIRIMENGLFTRSGKFNNKVKWEKNIFRFLTVIATAFIAWGGADDLDKFVALIGSFACVPLCFLYPPLLHLRACASSLRDKLLDGLVMLFGTVAMLYTTYITVTQWIEQDGPGGAPPGLGICGPKNGTEV